MEVTSPGLLSPFPALLRSVPPAARARRHSLEAWENKIDPVLFELARRPDARRAAFSIDGGTVLFQGNDDDLFQSLARAGRPAAGAEADVLLYAFRGLDDLAVLRRLKEYPDEAGREEIEACWLAECPENRSIIIVNADKA